MNMRKHDVRERKPAKLYLREWRKLRGLSQDKLAEILDTGKATISRLETGQQRYHQEWLEALAAALDVDPINLLRPPPISNDIPIFGYAGAREEVHILEGAEHLPIDTLQPPLPEDGYAAVIVRGDSMRPAYRPGDVLLFRSQSARRYDLEELYGRDCVVITECGRSWVKRVRKGRAPGLVDLVSYHPDVEPLYDMHLRWGAPILWVRRRG